MPMVAVNFLLKLNVLTLMVWQAPLVVCWISVRKETTASFAEVGVHASDDAAHTKRSKPCNSLLMKK